MVMICKQFIDGSGKTGRGFVDLLDLTPPLDVSALLRDKLALVIKGGNTLEIEDHPDADLRSAWRFVRYSYMVDGRHEREVKDWCRDSLSGPVRVVPWVITRRHGFDEVQLVVRFACVADTTLARLRWSSVLGTASDLGLEGTS